MWNVQHEQAVAIKHCFDLTELSKTTIYHSLSRTGPRHRELEKAEANKWPAEVLAELANTNYCTEIVFKALEYKLFWFCSDHWKLKLFSDRGSYSNEQMLELIDYNFFDARKLFSPITSTLDSCKKKDKDTKDGTAHVLITGYLHKADAFWA